MDGNVISFGERLDKMLILIATYSLSGQVDNARAEAGEILRIQPKLCVECFAKKLPSKDQAESERLIDALRKAGLK